MEKVWEVLKIPSRFDGDKRIGHEWSVRKAGKELYILGIDLTWREAEDLEKMLNQIGLVQ